MPGAGTAKLDLERAPGLSVVDMQTVELGRTGRQVSALALGAMQMGSETPEEESRTILDRYVEVGGSFVDTADCYEWWANPGSHGGHSEGMLGRGVGGRNKPGQGFLADKGRGLPALAGGLVG